MAEFIGYDANGTDGSDLSLMSALYDHRGKVVRIAADTLPQNVDNALAVAIGSTLTKEQQMVDAIQDIWLPLPTATNIAQANANMETLRKGIKAIAMYLRAQAES